MTATGALRLSWAGLLVAAAAAVALRTLPVSLPLNPGPVEPLTLPQVGNAQALAAEYGDSGVLVGKRNPFDPEGRRWIPLATAPKRRASAPPRRSAPDGIKGMFKIPGVEGVFIEDGFVSLGETVQGVRVKQVDQEGIVFSLDAKNTATWVNAERNQRNEAFRRRGLPLDEAD